MRYFKVFNKEIGYYGWRTVSLPAFTMETGFRLRAKELAIRIYHKKKFYTLFRITISVVMDNKENDSKYEHTTKRNCIHRNKR